MRHTSTSNPEHPHTRGSTCQSKNPQHTPQRAETHRRLNPSDWLQAIQWETKKITKLTSLQESDPGMSYAHVGLLRFAWPETAISNGPIASNTNDHSVSWSMQAEVNNKFCLKFAGPSWPWMIVPAEQFVASIRIISSHCLWDFTSTIVQKLTTSLTCLTPRGQMCFPFMSWYIYCSLACCGFMSVPALNILCYLCIRSR